MKDPPRQPHPFAVATEWVAKITTVALEMFLPAVGGRFLDQRLGTNYWVLAGLALGVTVGIWHLIRMTQPKSRNRSSRGDGSSGRGAAGR